MSDKSSAGAPRSAIWRRLIEQWRKEADRIDDRVGYTARSQVASAMRDCAENLDTALRACAEAPAPDDKKEETNDDLSRGGNQADRDRFQSSASTDGDVTSPAPNDERPNVFKAHWCLDAGVWTEQVGHTRPLKECRHWLCLAARQALLGIDTFVSDPVSALTPDCGLSANDIYHVMLAWEQMPASEEQTRIVIGLGKLRAQFIARGDSHFVQPLRAEALAPPAPGWQSIETCPRDTEVIFWLVPKTSEESYTDTSGRPIVTTHAPYWQRGKWKSWSALSKPTHWQPLPAPPRADALEAQHSEVQETEADTRGGSQ